MTRAIVASAFVLLSAAPAWAQAWLGSQGEITTSFVYSRQFVDEHDLNGLRDKNSDIFTNSMLADVTFSVRDNLAVTLAVPIVSSKFVTQGTPRHPTVQDDGSYHTTATDLRFDVRYNVFNRRNLVITPFIGSVTPSHKYEYFAHAAPGRRVKEITLVDGRKVKPRESYTLATDEATASGEGGFSMLAGTPVMRVGLLDVEAVAVYLRRLPQPVEPEASSAFQSTRR